MFACLFSIVYSHMFMVNKVIQYLVRPLVCGGYTVLTPSFLVRSARLGRMAPKMKGVT